MRGLREEVHIVQRGKILFQSMFLRIKAIITNSGAKPLFSWEFAIVERMLSHFLYSVYYHFAHTLHDVGVRGGLAIEGFHVYPANPTDSTVGFTYYVFKSSISALSVFSIPLLLSSGSPVVIEPSSCQGSSRPAGTAMNGASRRPCLRLSGML